MVNVVCGRQTLGPCLIAANASQRIRTYGAHKPSTYSLLGRRHGNKRARCSHVIFASSSQDSPLAPSRSEDTLKFLDSLLGSVDDGELEGTSISALPNTTLASNVPDGPDSVQDIVSVQQLSAPMRGDMQAGIRCAFVTVTSIV